MNIDYSLCGTLGSSTLTPEDPMVKIFGLWYQLAAEFYLGFSCFPFRYCYMLVFHACFWLLGPLYRVKKPASDSQKEK